MLRELAFEKLTSVKRIRNEPMEKALTFATSCFAFSIHLCLAQTCARCCPDAARPLQYLSSRRSRLILVSIRI
uniref:Uncharacterized protein n=1 Tax=Bradyrhizobium elkanii TaxID=29448 RepID=C4PL59_BRAEL|nr:hypothetical protein [Bradyrhizobium elkanii]